MISLQGKKAIVTGGAGGIGLAGVKCFREAGADVIIADINEEAGRRAAAETGATFVILYNNAGVYLNGRDGRVTDIDEAIWEKVIAINLRSVFLFCKYAIPLMMEHGGAIINTASSAGMIGIPDCDAYTATKGAIVQLTKSMAAEYGRYKIRVNCIAPAAIMTPMMRQSNPENSTFDENSFLNLRTPLRRYGTPEEIAQVARFLASDDASYLNGAIVVADGGITINGDLSYPDK